MKKKPNIKTIIRQIVREEVAMAIQEVITELKQPTQQQVSQPKPKRKVIEKKQFTSNSILNEVMNETAQNEEWKTLGGSVQTTQEIGNVLNKSYGDLMNGTQAPDIATSMGVAPNDPMAKFLNKDYSGLMKAMEKKNG